MKNKNNVIIVLILLIVLLIGGYFGYKNVYSKNNIDLEKRKRNTNY